MSLYQRMLDGMPLGARNKVTETLEQITLVTEMHNPAVALSMTPSAVRALVLKQGKKRDHVGMVSKHPVHFELAYGNDFPEMYELYRRAVANQWDGDWTLDWNTDVDPLNPEVPIIDREFFPADQLAEYGIRLSEEESVRLDYHTAAWMLSNFMHGEQGALYASAQVTESVKWMDGKLYGATQVMDEARHLEVFLRYLETKLERVYKVNDNLFTILDDLITDPRWDVKFLGMQIMVEGVALGAFTTMYSTTREPLLKELLRYVIQDEARHVHYGVLALREHISTLSEHERREREDWAFEVAILMRNRLLAHEIYEEWFAHKLPRDKWNEIAQNSPMMQRFRTLMFKRLVPNLEYIGLLSDRVRPHYASVGLTEFLGGRNATELTDRDLIADGQRLSEEKPELAAG